MAKVLEQDHDEADHPDNPEPDLENHLPDDSYPMEDSDIEDLLETSLLGQNGIHISHLQAFLLWIFCR